MMFSLFFIAIALSSAIAINLNCPSNLPKTDNLREYQNSCYEFILGQQKSWFHAEADCRMKGGTLVDIHSLAEQGFLFNTCQELSLNGVKDKGVWIGLTDHDNYHGEGVWHWVSNKAIGFVNWAPDQPGMVGGSEDCVLMEYSDNGYWHDYPCDGFFFLSENHGWICEYAI